MKLDDISKVDSLASDRRRLRALRMTLDEGGELLIGNGLIGSHTGKHGYMWVDLKDHPRILTSLRTEIATRLEAIEAQLKLLGVECG